MEGKRHLFCVHCSYWCSCVELTSLWSWTESQRSKTHLHDVSLCHLSPRRNSDVISIELNHGYEEKHALEETVSHKLSHCNLCNSHFSQWSASVTLNNTEDRRTVSMQHVCFLKLFPVLTIKLSLANSNDDNGHGEFSCLSWTERNS